jgi:hypothetical protein
MLFIFDFKDLKKQYPPLFEKERGDFYEFIL